MKVIVESQGFIQIQKQQIQQFRKDQNVNNKKLMILTLLESILLIVNAIAILNEKRFLKKYGFDTVSTQPNDVNEIVSSKNQVIMMIFTLRSIGKYVLIPLNIMAILLQILG